MLNKHAKAQNIRCRWPLMDYILFWNINGCYIVTHLRVFLIAEIVKTANTVKHNQPRTKNLSRLNCLLSTQISLCGVVFDWGQIVCAIRQLPGICREKYCAFTYLYPFHSFHSTVEKVWYMWIATYYTDIPQRTTYNRALNMLYSQLCDFISV